MLSFWLQRRLLALAALALPLCAQSNEQAAVAILQTNCANCHGSAQMSGLDLRHREGMLKGGKRGAAVVPGNAAQSLLYRALTGKAELKMPPGKAALSGADLDTLRAWIDRGAPWQGLAAETAWWSFRKLQTPVIPQPVSSASWIQNPIDAFVLSKLQANKLRPVAPASKEALIRRATFDLHGLPPSPAEVAAFANDSAPGAYEKLIDRLLASPRYGERWGRQWLDVVRYADTGGYETDVYFANAWRYRDYVIRCFNEDKPYPEFVKEQIAADEIWPDNLDLDGGYELPRQKRINLNRRIGTGLYTIGPMAAEFTFFGDQYRAEWQAEAVETTGSAFLGLTMGCARCHDHKFDPISQRDYYRFAALFAGSEDQEVPIVSRMGIYEYTRFQTRLVIADQLKEKLARLENGKGKGEKRQLTAAERDARESLLRQIGDAYAKAPLPYAKGNVLVHSETTPATHILQRGDFKQKGDQVTPGFPAALGGTEAAIADGKRRKALAEWITSPEQALAARVMVNRIWQGHFGRGIVATANDFGRQGEAPSHPELLDWLASEFAAQGYSVKAMHRLMMLSSAYRMSSAPDEWNSKTDPENRLLWRMNRRRLDAESLRDAVLASAGTLNLKTGGPPVAVPLTAEEREGMRDPTQWPVSPEPSEHRRRSVYLYVKRSFRLPMFEAFDQPDATASCGRRESSTVAPQALALMNSAFMVEQANAMAARLRKEHGPSPEDWVEAGSRLILGRSPSGEEKQKAAEFARRNGLESLCLLWFNTNEFLYVD